MTTSKKPQATRKKPATLHADPATIQQALDALGITVPYYTARVVGNRIELTLYGGQVVTWSPAPVPRSSPRLGDAPKED
jgi:hypothetical protein